MVIKVNKVNKVNQFPYYYCSYKCLYINNRELVNLVNLATPFRAYFSPSRQRASSFQVFILHPFTCLFLDFAALGGTKFCCNAISCF